MTAATRVARKEKKMSDYVCLNATGARKVFVRPSQVEYVELTTYKDTLSPAAVVNMKSGNHFVVQSTADVNAVIHLLGLPTELIPNKHNKG